MCVEVKQQESLKAVVAKDNASKKSQKSTSAHRKKKRTYPLVFLPIVSLMVCAGLVITHREALAAFCTFGGGFAVAPLLAGSAWTSLASRRRVDTGLKNLIGLVACTLAFWHLSGPYALELPGVSAEYLSLSIVAGYLAFDNCFSALYCSPPKAQWSVMEDILTLTIILGLLATSFDRLAELRPFIGGWSALKALRLAMQLEKKQDAEQGSSVVAEEEEEKAKAADESTIWTIHGQKYDLTEYVDRHPGGKETILLGRGRECTILFESYHPFSNKPREMLEKFRVESSGSPAKPVPARDPLYQIFCNRVEKVLQEKGIDPRTHRGANAGRLFQYSLIFGLTIPAVYYHTKGNFIASVIFGLLSWGSAAMGHDSMHFAAFRSDWANTVCQYLSGTTMSNPVTWQHQHTYAHHSFVNDFDQDPDLHHWYMFFRMHRRFRQKSVYKNQANRLYVLVIFTLSLVGMLFAFPIHMATTDTLHGRVVWSDRNRPLRTAALFIHMAAYMGVVMILPFWADVPWYQALACAMTPWSLCGFIFSLNSQINHLNEACLDETMIAERAAKRHPEAKGSWVVEQVEHSNNWATDSDFWYYTSNGLNMQIEHHLFPSLNHCHLHHIIPTVQELCKEYGLYYKEYSGWGEVLGTVFDWMEKLATEPYLVADKKMQ